MPYRIIWPIVLAVFCLFWLNRVMNKNARRHEKGLKDFIKDEMDANTARRHDIESEFFYDPDINDLPIMKQSEISERIYSRQNTALKLSERKMIRFPKHMSNRELKLKYGLSNLETITQYEDNLQNFLQALIKWGSELQTAEMLSEAEAVLNCAIRNHSEYSKNYIMLGEIYNAQNNCSKLQELINHLDTTSFSEEGEIYKPKIISQLKSMQTGRSSD